MKRATTRILLGLVLLPVVAFILRRGAREETPQRPPRQAPRVEQAPAEPGPAVTLLDRPQPSPPRTPPPAPPAAAPPEVLEPPKPGIIRGTVRISGIAPARRKIRLAADPKCAKLHPGGIVTDDIVVDLENNVRWAFVYVARGVNGPLKPPLLPVLLDQVGCAFEPHVLGVQVGQKLNIYNNDPLLHNVHSLPFVNQEFNFGLPAAGLYETKTFLRPEVMVKIVCDVHPWMKAWVGVLDHPHFSVTSETGTYGIANLPPGRYLVKAWHELYATVEREIELLPGDDVRADFWLDARKASD